jgi:hypothetical protein
MLSPLPRRSGWAYYFRSASPSRISLPRKGCRVGLRIVLFEDCSAFTRVTACTLALSPIRDTHSEGFSYFVTSIAAPVASGWSGCRVGLTPTGKRRLITAHTRSGHHPSGTPAISMPSRIRLLPARNVGSLLSMSPRVRRMVKAGSSASPARTEACASSSDPTSARAAAS